MKLRQLSPPPSRASSWVCCVLSSLCIVGALAPMLAAVLAPREVRAAAAEPVFSRKGMVATSVGPAARVGREVLEAGGNAVDAAIATGFAAACAHHFSSGIGGGGFFVIHIAAERKSYVLDAREVAPAATTAALYRTAEGEPDPEKLRSGGASVAVPGLVQGFAEAHERFGKLPWKQVIAPAARLCREGVAVTRYHQRILQVVRDRMLERNPETARIQLDQGQVPELGWKLVQEDLAATYDRIAEAGVRAMTEGPIAEAIVETVRSDGGVLSLEDLAGYRTRWREPVVGRYRGYEIVSMPPPSSGGIALVEMLNVLEHFDLRAAKPNSSEMLHLLAGAMQLAFADRAVYLGDPAFYDVPQDWLTSSAYADELAARMLPAPFFARPPWRWGKPKVLHVQRPSRAPIDDSGTTHISVMDAEGNAVALTQTVNTLFGSGLTARGTGIVLNNEMDDFALAPNTPNAFELLGADANSIEAGKRPLSSMTPTLVLRDGQVRFVTGSPMGPYIITTVLQTLIHLIDFDMDVQQAVSMPRVHHQWRPDELRMEPEHPRDVVERLEWMGHPVVQGDRHFGASATLGFDPEARIFFGAKDPRRDAGAEGP